MARPELMAIGDSIYNGVRSLTIDAGLAAFSVPAQVAKAFGWEFIVPDYPRPVLADIESLFSNPLVGSLDFIRNAVANAHRWMAPGAWSQQPLFHNLSIAQQTVEDLWAANYNASLAVAQSLVTQGAALKLEQLPVLYQALNTCFILNPQRTPGASKTALDLLAEIGPKRLLINIGINDGLWTLLLMADPADYQQRIDPSAAMSHLAITLQEKCPDIDHFYINLFPKPSAIANLMPRTDSELPENGYFELYLGRLLQNGGISGDKMREIDEWVQTTLNPKIMSAFGRLGERAHFVDLYAVNLAYDRKNGLTNNGVTVVSHGQPVLIDNDALEVFPIIGGRKEGGLFGLDNLHPTFVGYGIIAQAVCDLIAATENLPPPIIDQQSCFDHDTLLNHLPPGIALADFVLDFIGAFV